MLGAVAVRVLLFVWGVGLHFTDDPLLGGPLSSASALAEGSHLWHRGLSPHTCRSCCTSRIKLGAYTEPKSCQFLGSWVHETFNVPSPLARPALSWVDSGADCFFRLGGVARGVTTFPRAAAGPVVRQRRGLSRGLCRSLARGCSTCRERIRREPDRAFVHIPVQAQPEGRGGHDPEPSDCIQPSKGHAAGQRAAQLQILPHRWWLRVCRGARPQLLAEVSLPRSAPACRAV